MSAGLLAGSVISPQEHSRIRPSTTWTSECVTVARSVAVIRDDRPIPDPPSSAFDDPGRTRRLPYIELLVKDRNVRPPSPIDTTGPSAGPVHALGHRRERGRTAA